MKNFKKELETLINQCSLENESDTPDFILAEYLQRCLDNYNKTLQMREEWWGRPINNQIDLREEVIENLREQDCSEEDAIDSARRN